jgi:uncharacterized protein YcfL
MKKYFLFILTFLVTLSCSVIEKTEQRSIGSVIYKTQVSKKVVNNEDYSSTPKISEKSVILRQDSTFQIKYSTIKGLKKHKGEYYSYIENTVDTIKAANTNSLYIKTEYLLSGTFLAPKGQIPYSNFSDRGLKFLSDGSCTYTWISHCSDSPCSTTHQNRGEYKYVNDTIVVTYFLHRFFGNNMIPAESNTIKSINDVQWRVVEPTVLKYNLSKSNDTLFALDDTRYSQIGTKWIINDTIKLLPTIKHQ